MDFFSSEYVASWVSVEHDVRWAERVRKILAKLPWGDKVRITMITVGLVMVKMVTCPHHLIQLDRIQNMKFA